MTSKKSPVFRWPVSLGVSDHSEVVSMSTVILARPLPVISGAELLPRQEVADLQLAVLEPPAGFGAAIHVDVADAGEHAGPVFAVLGMCVDHATSPVPVDRIDHLRVHKVIGELVPLELLAQKRAHRIAAGDPFIRHRERRVVLEQPGRAGKVARVDQMAVARHEV